MTFYHDAKKGKYLEGMTYNWLLKQGILKKYIKYVGNRKKFYDFELIKCILTKNKRKYKKIETKTLGYYKDYLFLETYSVYENRDSGWAFGIDKNKIHNKIRKDVLYVFANKTNKKIVIIGGYDLYNIGKFLYLSGKKIRGEVTISEIKIDNKILTQTVQHTPEQRYHSVQLQIPLKDVEKFIGKKSISAYKGEYLLK